MTLVFLFLSVLNPIFLVNSYERFKEKTRKMAKTMDKNTMQQMKATRAIKDQWTAFVRIELGNDFNFLIIFTLNCFFFTRP